MRIAQVAPLYESVPPRYYGGTERVVSYLTEELVQQTHDVTLFASGDSSTSGTLVSVVERSLRLDPECQDEIAPHLLMLEQVMQRAQDFDIVHFHCDYLHYPLTRHLHVPHVTTLHGRLDLPYLGPLYDEFCDVPTVSISYAQRIPLPQAFYCGTVYHGLPRDLLTPRFAQGDYFAFLGRISPEKGVLRAIEIATRLGVPLKIAAKVSRDDVEYYHREVEPLLSHPLIEFVGEIAEHQKAAFLGRARALLFTIDWPEPFGLAMIESMACGTPVLAYAWGSVPEILEPGVSGFIVHDMDEALYAAQRIHTLDRVGCRAAFERRFTAQRMAQDYVDIYTGLLARPQRSLPSTQPLAVRPS